LGEKASKIPQKLLFLEPLRSKRFLSKNSLVDV
jgi:hypothetical protein